MTKVEARNILEVTNPEYVKGFDAGVEQMIKVIEPLWHKANQSGMNGNPPAGSKYAQEVFKEWLDEAMNCV